MSPRDYIELRTGGGKALAAGGLHESRVSRLLDDPRELLWENLDRPVKIDHGSLMVETTLPLGAAAVPVAYKQYRRRSCWKAFCRQFRRSRARRAWHVGRELLRQGIATARPLAVFEPGRRGFRPASYLATEWIEGAENLHLYGWRLAELPLGQRLGCAARCAESLGRLIGQMHARHIAHRDLKAANLLVVRRNDHTETYLIDTDGVRIGRRLSRKRRAANLARLAAGLEAHPWVSRTVCCRFLRAYVAQLPPGTALWKPLWREIAVRSRRIVDRKRRRAVQVL